MMASVTSAGKKRKSFSLETKAMIIEEVEKKEKTKSQICRDHSISSGTLYTFLRDKDVIMTALTKGDFQPDRKRLKTAEAEDLDRGLIAWYNQAQALNAPLSGPILQEKGEELAKELGLINFKMNRGWLSRFKNRHGLVMKTVHHSEEAAPAPIDMSRNWKQTKLAKIMEVLGCYPIENIFSAVETGLFYKCLPNKTLVKKGELCTGQEVQKDQISILIAANMSGNQKLPLVVIGKHGKPGCLRNIRTLPVTYRANKKALMTCFIFEEWVRKLDRKMLKERRRIALVIDDNSSHPHFTGLRAIKLIFLPPNSNSLLQPCDQGIIQNFKNLYRKKVLQRFISSVESRGCVGSHYSLTILDAINFASASWNEVKQQTIINCFRKAGFTKCGQDTELETEAEQVDMEIKTLFDQTQNILPGDQTLVEYLEIDNDAPTIEQLTMQEITMSLHTKSTEMNEEEDDDDDKEVETVPAKKAQEAIETLRLYLEQHENTTQVLLDLNKVENSTQKVMKATKQQSKITSFFKPFLQTGHPV